MSKESNFLIYCMERYRYFKGLSGADVAKNFEKYDIYGYITKYFESLHTMGDNCIVQDIDDYISRIVQMSVRQYIPSGSCSNSEPESNIESLWIGCE